MKTAMLALAILMSACGGDGGAGGGPGGGGLTGTTWAGSVAGFAVTLKVDQDYGSAFQGVVSTTRAMCFNNGQVSATVANTSIMIAASGSGTASSSTLLFISGERKDDRIDGLFSMSGTNGTETCDVQDTPISLTRQ